MEKELSISNIASNYGTYNIVDDEIVFENPDEISISNEDLWKEIDADWERRKAREYARNRQEEYPSMGDQLDMIYKDNLNSTTTHKDAVEAVKAKWPKDNSGPV